LLGLFKILLSRYTGQQDIAVMSVFAGRNYSQTKTLLGLLTNLFFIRSHIDPEASLQQQILSENHACMNALQNLDYPFEKLIQDLWPDHEQRNAALGNVYFILQNYPLDNKEDGDLQIKMLDIGADAAKFDLLITIEEDNEELYCWIEYRTALYEEALIHRLAGQFSRLCKLYVQKPGLDLQELDILLPEERDLLSRSYNANVRDFPLQSTYIELWRQNLAGFTQRRAVVCPEGEFSYQELESRSNQLANYLWGLGAEPGMTIAICLPRGICLAAALLAIWKLGAAYLPLDPKYPAERLLYMVKDAGIRLILGESKFREIFDPVCNTGSFLTATLYIAADEEELSILQQADEFELSEQNPDSCAYLIYSSGSTGKPKGVMISQRNLLNHNLAVIEAFGLNPEDRVMQFGSISFDLSIEEIFPTWLAGASLIFRTDDVLNSFESFWAFAASHKITVMDLPTAFWHALVDELDKHGMTPDLRLCIIGGEKASPEKLAIWHKHSRDEVRLLNSYGPTETTIIATLHEADPELNHQHYPIGKPIANLQVYILDDQLRLLPATAKGELCIGGEGVGMGYLNLPELTKKSFIPDPFSCRPGAVIYRTGDLAAWSENGDLHFWGRIDNQVKLLGHRIEPSEIENLLRKHPQIKDAGVALRADAAGNPHLAAYLIYREGKLSNSELRSYLGQELPDYMIPSSFTALDSFPHTPGGKLDLKAFPAPQLTEYQPDKEYVGFYNPEQEVLCRTIAEILNLEKVSVKDNFFALGGNSILSLQLIQKLRHAGLQLNVDQLFQSANVEDLAAGMSLLQVSDNSYGAGCLIELKKGSLDKPVLVLVHSLPGDVLGYVNLVHKLPADLAVYGLQALGLIDPKRAHHSIDEMAEFYLEVLRAQAFPHGFHLAGWCFGGRVAVEMALKLRRYSKRAPRLFLFETYAYNPVNSLRLPYMLYRSSLILRNHRRMRAIIQRKLKQIAPALPGTSQAEIFLETGIFRNRAQVRQINIKAIFSNKLHLYPWEVVLFKAKTQDPNMLQDPTLGWKVFAPKIKILEVDSTHENILKDPQVDSIAAKMNELLV
jgi:amino acid adenylation domain-containing protein